MCFKTENEKKYSKRKNEKKRLCLNVKTRAYLSSEYLVIDRGIDLKNCRGCYIPKIPIKCLKV